jgi:hypothetical protein
VNSQVVGVIWGAIKSILREPIVKKALDHWTEGTSNKIDDWVWDLLKKLSGIKDEVDRDHAALEGVATLQAKYDWAKDSGIVESLKMDVKRWDSASVNLTDTYPSGNSA